MTNLNFEYCCWDADPNCRGGDPNCRRNTSAPTTVKDGSQSAQIRDSQQNMKMTNLNFEYCCWDADPNCRGRRSELSEKHIRTDHRERRFAIGTNTRLKTEYENDQSEFRILLLGRRSELSEKHVRTDQSGDHRERGFAIGTNTRLKT